MEPRPLTESVDHVMMGSAPSMVDDSVVEAFRFVCASARTELDEEAYRYVDTTVDRLNWPRTLAIGRFHRVIPLMHWSLSRAFGARLPDEERAYLEETFRKAAIFNLAFAEELALLNSALEDAGIPCIGFKGPAYAQLAYENLGLRPCTDVDILIPDGTFDVVQEILEGRGYWLAKHVRDLRGENRERFLHMSGQAAFVRGRAGSVDVHLAVMPPGYRFDERFDALHDRSQLVQIGATRMRTFAPEDQLMIMSFHGVKNRWETLRHVADIAELVRSHGSLDWQVAIERARGSKAERIVRLGLAVAASLSGAVLPEEVRAWIERDRGTRRLLERVTDTLAQSHERSTSAGARFRFHLNVQETLATKVRYLSYVIRRRRYNWVDAGAE